MSGKNKVLLFCPPYEGPPLGAPLSLLYLKSPLLQSGFEVKPVDNLLAPDCEATILREAENALLLGISAFTGPDIGPAVRVAKAIKKLNPTLPIVFGGWQASLATEQTLCEPYVDAVVRGQGELTLLDLTRTIAEGSEWHGVSGLSFKEPSGRAIHEQERPVADINTLPALLTICLILESMPRSQGSGNCLTRTALAAQISRITAPMLIELRANRDN